DRRGGDHTDDSRDRAPLGHARGGGGGHLHGGRGHRGAGARPVRRARVPPRGDARPRGPRGGGEPRGKREPVSPPRGPPPGGGRVTTRVSPGYAGWDTAEQRQLFALCPGAPIGVTLNEACFMLPAKTITFLVGVGPAVRVDHYFTQCRRCWMRDCAYRRAPALTTVRR